ncbi:MAG: ribonuclease III [Bacilli bacterium]|nr:ribonuclease III [Bacilli bacterium]MDD7315789.1 ribonuclease III [Bacilli bacterium]MDY4052353.1 ribonuclease III [Bacilli bacterium]
MFNIELLKEILAKYDVHVREYDNFFLAMTHSSYANEHGIKHNERIEYLGDAILGLLVAEYIYINFPDMSEGNMSKLRATYVCEEANMKYAKEIGIDKLILLGHGEEQMGGRKRPAILSDAFESFLGAIYLDGSIDEVRKVLKVVVYPHVLAINEVQFIDYKSRLQEYVQAETRSAIVYRLDNVDGPPHNRVFTISVCVDGITLGTGVGKSKKDAAQEAAKSALDKAAIE